MTATLLLALALAPAADGKDGKPKPTPLEGVWRIERVGSAGRAIDLDRFGRDRYTLVAVGDRFVMTSYAGTLAADPEKKSVDLAITDGLYKGQTRLGRYDLAGDTLTLVLTSVGGRGTTVTAERPADVTAGPGRVVYTYRRDKSATPEQAATMLKERSAAVAAPAFGRGGSGGSPATPSTQDLLRQVLDRLDRIEKRLDAMEKDRKK